MVEPDPPEDDFGFAVGGGGDVNGDGFADVIVGSPGTVDGDSRGRAYVLLGTDETR